MNPMPVLLALVLPALGSITLAQNVKINSPLAPELAGGNVQEEFTDPFRGRFAFTPDGTRVVYCADREQRDRFELYSRPMDGSQPSRVLSGPMQPQGDVRRTGGFQVSASGRVVYLADESVDGVDELFSVPADGSSNRIRLSQAGLPVSDFWLDSSGARVAYKHRLQSGYGSLHVASIDGSAAPVTLWPEATVSHVWFAPDGLRAVFSHYEFFSIGFSSGIREHLYVAPIDGSTAPVHLAVTGGGLISDFNEVTFTPDGTQVVYGVTADLDGDEDFSWSIGSVRLDASQPAIQILHLLRPDFALDTRVPPRVIFATFADMRSTLVDGSSPVTLSAPGSRQPSSAPRLLGNDVFFSTVVGTGYSTISRAPSDGSLPTVQLFPGMPGGIYESFVFASPQSIAFLQSQIGAFLVSSTGGTPELLHPPLPQPVELIADPSGRHLLLRSDFDVAGITDLYSFDLADLSRVRLSHEQAPDSDVVEARFAPGGQVVYRTRTLGHGTLFTVPADASASPLQLNEPIPTGNIAGDVSGFRVTRDGRKLVYRADQVTDDHHDLYAVDAVTTGLPVLLTEDVGSVESQFFLLEPPGLVLFQTRVADGFRLNVTNLSGSRAIELDAASLGFGQSFVTAHDGRRLVYRKAAASQQFELWSVLLDGSASPVRLHAPLPSDREVSAFRVAADGTVVFRSDLGQNDVFELFSVSAKGGTPRRISGPMVANGDVEAFEVDATGKFAAFAADAGVNGKLELFVVPLDGSQPPERRSGLMPAQGDVSSFVFAGDGRHLVYLADQINDQRFDLFSTPILGSFGSTSGLRRTSLGTTLLSRHAGVRNVKPDIVLVAEGTSVLYRVGLGVSIELFLVPVDGSARPTPLSGPLASGRFVSAAALAADRGHVVYLADQLVDERFELFSVPLTGGTPVALDSPPFFGDVVDFEIAQDSRHVVFRADRDSDEVFELYRVPIDGSAPAVRVSGPMVPGGDTQPGFVAMDGRTLYTADQEQDEVFELFLTR